MNLKPALVAILAAPLLAILTPAPAGAAVACSGTTPTHNQSTTYSWSGAGWIAPGILVRPQVVAADVKVTLKYQDCNDAGTKIRPVQLTVKWTNTNPVNATALFMQDELFDSAVGFDVYNGSYPDSPLFWTTDYLGATNRTWTSGDLTGMGWVLVSDGPYVQGWWTIRDYDYGHPGDVADANVTHQFGNNGYMNINP